MIGGVAWLHGDKGSAAGSANFVVCNQLTFDYCAVFSCLHHARD